jgi:tRNA 2-thiouridine synthesizing protein A
MRQPSEWFDDPKQLPARVYAVLSTLEKHRSANCDACGKPICAHSVLFSFVLGYGESPACHGCLALRVDRPEGSLASELASFALSKECLTIGLRRADQWEADSVSRAVDCPIRGGIPSEGSKEGATPAFEAVFAFDAEPTESWDAGDLGCGELALELRRRLEALPKEGTFRLTTRDLGAREDVPAWCRMTGHPLLRADHPVYWIQRRELGHG